MARTDSFDRSADTYDDWFVRHADLYRAEVELIRPLLPPPDRLGIEVGVGTGRFAEPLGIRIGVEPSEPMAQRARSRGVEVHHGVAEALPFPDDSFDFVLMVTTLCFLDDVPRSFREAARVLRSGGHLIVGFIDRDSELSRLYQAEKAKHRFYGAATFYSTPDVLRILDAAHFQMEVVRQTLIPGEPPDHMVDGYGRGAFVAIRAAKLPVISGNLHSEQSTLTEP